MGVELGELVAGLRSNDEAVVDALRRVLAPIRIDDLDVFPNLSLYMGEGQGKTRELHRLYCRGDIVLRTASVGRLLRSALQRLDAFLPPLPGLVPLRGDLLLGGSGAVLVKAPLASVDLPERRVRRMGWRGTDGAAAFLDPATLEVVIAESRLTLDPAALAEIDERWPHREGEEGVEPGRYPIRAAVLLGTQPDDLVEASPARRLSGLASLLDTSIRPARATDVVALRPLDGRVDVVRPAGYDGSEFVSVLRDLTT